MGGLCNNLVGWAEWFLWFAFAAAIVEVGLALWAKRPKKALDRERHEGLAAGPDLDGLAKVLQALKDLPPWIAIFLAALALAWTAATAPGLCAP
jgi:hypothetical protein